jgi:type II secretory pathway component PulC
MLQLAVMALLIIVLLIQLLIPAPEPKTLSTSQLTDQPPLTELQSLPESELEIEQFDEISERPLFYSTRKPQEISTAMTATQKPNRTPEQDWVLTGIILNGEDNKALFNAIGKKNHESLKNGMKLSGWTLDEITPDSVTFSNNGREINMQLIKPSAPSSRRTKNNKRSSSLFINKSQYGKVVRPLDNQ